MTLELARKLICRETNVSSMSIEDCNALTYILLMDAAYQIYYKHLRLMPLKQKYKQLRNDIRIKWAEWIKYFNRDLNEDEIADIGDAMDVFHEYIANIERGLCYSVLNEAGKLPEKYRKLISYTQVALLLARSADFQYSYIYKEPLNAEFHNPIHKTVVTLENNEVGSTERKVATLNYPMMGMKPKPSPPALLNFIGALERFMAYIVKNAEREKCVCLFNSNPDIQINVNAFINKTTTMPYDVILTA